MAQERFKNVTRVELTPDFYLFHNNGGPCRQLLIWSHGGYLAQAERFVAQNTLAWMAEKGKIFAGGPLDSLLDDDVGYHELVYPGSVVEDCILTKLPGHQTGASLRENYSTVDHVLATRKVAMDVLSVRNRFLTKRVTLKQALAAVNDKMPGQYGIVALAFCRALPGVNAYGSYGDSGDYLTDNIHDMNDNRKKKVNTIPGYTGANLLPAGPDEKPITRGRRSAVSR